MSWGETARSPAALFAVDVRSLAALRIGLGAVLLIDLAVRATDLSAHYADAGVLPRAMLLARAESRWRFSVHSLGGSASFEATLFCLAAVFGFLLLIGLRTRLATAVSWLMLISLHARNPLVLQGGDTLLRLLLFWAMFLPLGAVWSVDAAGRPPPAGGRIASPATAALMIQVCLVYWFSAALKSYRVWHVEATAVGYALNIDQFATPYGRALLAYPALLGRLSRLVYWTECIGPALAFMPVCIQGFRLAVIAVFGVLHLGFGLCLALGLFPVISALAWVPFLGTAFWDAVAPRTRALSTAAPALYGSTPAGLAAFVLLAYVTWWNLDTLPGRAWRMPSGIRRVGQVLRLDQRWGMFAPAPLRDDGWYVICGRLAAHHTVDLLHAGTSLAWRKPADVSAMYRNQRWRKYLMRLSRKRFASYRAAYARYLCTLWDHVHYGDESLRALRIYFMREQTLAPDRIAAPRRALLLRHRCERT